MRRCRRRPTSTPTRCARTEPAARPSMAVAPHAFILPDVLAPGLSVVFCGTAPGRASAARGAYYAHPGNRFWRALHDCGLTPRLLPPEEFLRLLDHGAGLTDLNKTEFGADRELSPTLWDRAGLAAKLRAFRPRRVAFTSKNAAAACLGAGEAPKRGGWGRLDRRLEGVEVWMLPSPSGQAAGSWDIGPWRELAAAVRADRWPFRP